VRSHKGILTIAIWGDDAGRHQSRKANIIIGSQEVTVDEPWACLLEDGIIQLEDLPADELVVAIDDYKDL
jgi:hypothetical protein